MGSRGKGKIWYEKRIQKLTEELATTVTQLKNARKFLESANEQMEEKDTLITTQRGSIVDLEGSLGAATIRATEEARRADAHKEHAKLLGEKLRDAEGAVRTLVRIGGITS